MCLHHPATPHRPTHRSVLAPSGRCARSHNRDTKSTATAGADRVSRGLMRRDVVGFLEDRDRAEERLDELSEEDDDPEAEVDEAAVDD